MKRNCLVLTQLRKSSEYNDFVGKFYHFPDKYIGQFNDLPIEFIYYEPAKIGEGVYFGCGKIKNQPVSDKKEKGHYFVEIIDYKPFAEPVSFKESDGKNREADSPHYNSQNAVRKIPSELLDEICLDGKVLLNFKADAHLVKVLGEQLIASEKVGILELIKNSYDAGASYCRVRIEKIPSMLPPMSEEKYSFPELSGPVIIIEDDGSGMTREVIENGWLRPASTIKTNVKERIRQERGKAIKEGKLEPYDRLIAEMKKERDGRIPLGEKGVGRFASHRLGKHLLLKTKVSNLDYEFVMEIDWDKFESLDGEQKDLESVGIRISRQKPSRDYGKNGSGTQMIIYGGREGFFWDEDIVRKMNNSILSLNTPNPTPENVGVKNGFNVSLECPQIGALPKDNLFDSFPSIFCFDGKVSKEGILEYSLKFQPPRSVPMPEEEIKEKIDLRSADLGYWENKNDEDTRRSPECGSFYMHLDVWYRKSPWVNLTNPDGKEFLRYLDDFGGISIFRDGINILPAEWVAEIDWLNLNKRHIKKGDRMSYYNMVGNIEIDQANNIDLIDKTNREGMVKNRAFNDFTELVYTIIESIVEIRFQGKRDDFTALTGDVIRNPRTLQEYAKRGAELASGVKENYPIYDDPYKILGSFGEQGERGENLANLSNSLKGLQKSIKLLEESQDLFTEQAGYGMAVAVSVHEIAKITSNFYSGVSYLLKSEKPDPQKLKDLQEASGSLRSELKRLSPLRAIRNEQNSEFAVIKPISYVVEMFRSKIEKLGIVVEVETKENFSVYGRYGVLIQIFSNLFDNSCYWVGMNPRKERKIKIKIDSKNRIVIFSDSGPGIDEVILPYLFRPGYSLRIPPSGLGLYICKHYMQSMKGDIYVTNVRERISDLSGAQFTLDLGRVPSERFVK